MSVFSVALKRVSHDHEHEHDLTLRQDSNQHDNGLALCFRVILDSEVHQWVQAGHPRHTGARTGRLWVAHKLYHDGRPNDTDKRQDKRAHNWNLTW